MTKESYQKLSSVIRRNITLEQWKDFTTQQQNMYITYLTDPNHFFFRSSMIFQIKQTGEFTLDEDQMFKSRFKYFREDLNIQKIPWGFFAIPFYGRAGYQCAAHYRELLINDYVDPDPEYPFVDGRYPKGIFWEDVPLKPEIQQALEDEAYQYVTSQMENEYMGDFEFPPSEFLVGNVSEKGVVHREPKIAQKKLPQINVGSKSVSQLPDAYMVNVEILDGGSDTHDDIPSYDENYKRQSGSSRRQSDSSAGTPRHSRQSSANPEPEDGKSSPQTPPPAFPPSPQPLPEPDLSPPPAQPKYPPRKAMGCSFMPGFADPLTKDPVQEPMMDPNGFVMDKKSWEKCLGDRSICPCPLEISDMSDLIALTKDNFESLCAFITNWNK